MNKEAIGDIFLCFRFPYSATTTRSTNEAVIIPILYKLFLFVILVVTVSANDSKRDGIPLQQSELLVDEGDNVLLNCSFSDQLPNDAFKWTRNGRKLNSSGRYYIDDRAHSLMVRGISLDDEGVYLCEKNSVPLNKVAITVREKLRFFPIPTNKLLELGSNSSIPCKTRGFLSPTIQWMKKGHNGDQLPTHLRVENGTLYFDDVKKEDSGKYTCIATNGAEVINATIKVDIVALPKFIIPPVPQKVREGDNVTLNCLAQGIPKPTIYWNKNHSLNIVSSRYVVYPNGTLFIKNAKLEDTGKYGCNAGNIGGFKRIEVKLEVYRTFSGLNSTISIGRNTNETVTLQ